MNKKIILKIGCIKHIKYEFNETDVLLLDVKEKYKFRRTIYNTKRGRKAIITYLILNKKTNKYERKSKEKKIKVNDKLEIIYKQLEENINNDNLEIIKDKFEISALKLSKLDNKQLKFFRYIPVAKKYNLNEELPIDPYYLGFWLGDGHSATGSKFTCGGDSKIDNKGDQKYIIPYIEEMCKNLNLKLNIDKSKNITFTISKKIENNEIKKFKLYKHSKYLCINNKIFNEDWVEEAEKDCLKLKKSKETCTPYTNFRINYEKKLNNNISSKDKWNSLTIDEKDRYKLTDNKKDILKNSKYMNSKSLSEIFKIYQETGRNGLIDFRKNSFSKCNILNLNFHKLNLINNKHIPNIYLKSSIENRKKLLAGLIDSDGYKDVNRWEIVQKNKNISNGIKKLCESLGMFVRSVDKICKAKKKNGSYSKGTLCTRMFISPINNRDIPVLLPRKKISNQCNYPTIKNII